MRTREHNQTSLIPQEQHDGTRFCITGIISKRINLKNGENLHKNKENSMHFTKSVECIKKKVEKHKKTTKSSQVAMHHR